LGLCGKLVQGGCYDSDYDLEGNDSRKESTEKVEVTFDRIIPKPVSQKVFHEFLV
jgi:hypothetical protein